MAYYQKEQAMLSSSDREMAAVRQTLSRDPTLVEQLPHREGEILRLALTGQNVHQIAQHMGLTEAAVWEVLGNAARLASGKGRERVETAGLGSDTDPGVTGGYGETGFGGLGNEPPFPNPEEPDLAGSNDDEVS
jgi:hypothetical protein